MKDDERRDKELEIYSQELGIPLDWFAAKRKEKLAEAKRKHKEDMTKLKKEVGERLKAGMMSAGITERSGVSSLSTFAEEGEGEGKDEDDVDEDTASESDISFTSGSSYSYSATDDDEAPATDDDGEEEYDEEDGDGGSGSVDRSEGDTARSSLYTGRSHSGVQRSRPRGTSVLSSARTPHRHSGTPYTGDDDDVESFDDDASRRRSDYSAAQYSVGYAK